MVSCNMFNNHLFDAGVFLYNEWGKREGEAC